MKKIREGQKQREETIHKEKPQSRTKHLNNVRDQFTSPRCFVVLCPVEWELTATTSRRREPGTITTRTSGGARKGV